jgi:hypothetical protein
MPPSRQYGPDASKVQQPKMAGSLHNREALNMALNPARFTFPRALKSTLIAVGLVVASVSLLSPQLLDDFPQCMASLTTPGAGRAAAATATPPAATTPPAAVKQDAMSSDMHAPTVFTSLDGGLMHAGPAQK